MRRHLWLFLTGLLLLSACSTKASESANTAAPASSGALASLQIGGLPLTPAFSPEQLDYTTRCEGSLPSNVTAAAQVSTDKVTLSLASPVTFSPMTRLDVQVSRAGITQREYSVRCLPSDFPYVSLESVAPSTNWLLTALTNTTDTDTFSVLLDPAGVPVWFARNQGAHEPSLQPTAPGRFLRVPILDNDLAAFSVVSGAEITEEDFTGKVLRSWKTPQSLFVDHHDAVVLTNGNLLTTSYIPDSTVSLTNAPTALAPPGLSLPGCATGLPSGDDTAVVSRLIEISPNGKLVSELRLTDVIPNSSISFPLRINMETDPKKPARCGYDMFHMNAVDIVDEDRVLVSSLALDGVMLIERSSHKLLWRLGGLEQPESLKIVGDPLGAPKRVHDGRMVSKDEVMLFDNRMLFPEDHARAVLYKIDTKAKTATFEKQWLSSCSKTPCNSGWGGSARISADGNIFVNTGGRRNGPSVEEFREDGSSVARYNFGIAYRSFPLADVGFSRTQLREATDKSADAVVSAAESAGCAVQYFGSCSR